MRFVRIATPSGMFFATMEADKARQLEATPFTAPVYTGQEFAPADYRLLAPMLPSKIIGITKNGWTFKPPTAVIGPQAAVRVPAFAGDVEMLPGLAMVIAKPCKDVAPARWREAVIGFSLLADVFAPNLAPDSNHKTHAASLDTFCPLGPWIDSSFDPTESQLAADAAADLLLTVQRQSKDGANNHPETIFTVELSNLEAQLSSAISQASAGITLLPGDIIYIPMSSDSIALHAGEAFTIELSGLGSLEFKVS